MESDPHRFLSTVLTHHNILEEGEDLVVAAIAESYSGPVVIADDLDRF